MAAFKIYPEDYQQHYGSLAIKLPMNVGNSNNQAEIFNLSYTTEDQAISNYINLLLTRKGERYMQPEFGIGLHWYLFEQNTDLFKKELEDEIYEQASIWLPYIFNDEIIISDFTAFNGDSKNAINIVIKFRVTEYGANRTINIIQGVDQVPSVEIS